MDNTLLARFQKWQWILAVLHYLAAIVVTAIVATHDDWKVPVYIAYNTWERTRDNACSHQTPCLLSEFRTILPNSISIGACAATFSVFSGTHHFLLAMDIKRSKHVIETGINAYRWFDYVWSASLMFAVNSVMWVAPINLQGFVNWFGLQFCVVVIGYGSEVAWAKGEQAHAAAMFAGACLPYAASWVTAWAAFVISVTGGDPHNTTQIPTGTRAPGDPVPKNNPPHLIWALLLWLCGSFFIFPIVHGLKLASLNNNPTTNLKYETYYAVLSMLAKLPLLTVFATGIIGRGQRTTFSAPPKDFYNNTGNGTATDNTVTTALGIASATFIALGWVIYADLVRYRSTGLYRHVVSKIIQTKSTHTTKTKTEFEIELLSEKLVTNPR
jgi:hypothetical protein